MKSSNLNDYFIMNVYCVDQFKNEVIIISFKIKLGLVPKIVFY